jgi:hypothetical protein
MGASSRQRRIADGYDGYDGYDRYDRYDGYDVL